MCRESSENEINGVLKKEFPIKFNEYILNNNHNGVPIIISLAINEQYEMLKYLFDKEYVTKNISLETTIPELNNIIHMCIMYAVSPRIFMLCHEYNQINFYTPNIYGIVPMDILSNDYASKLLNEKSWRKHRILFLIQKECDDSIRGVIMVRELHNIIFSFM